MLRRAARAIWPRPPARDSRRNDAGRRQSAGGWRRRRASSTPRSGRRRRPRVRRASPPPRCWPAPPPAALPLGPFRSPPGGVRVARRPDAPIGRAMPRRHPPPRGARRSGVWLFTDERAATPLARLAALLPPGSGIVVGHDGLAPGARWRLFRRLARIARARHLSLLLAGPPALARRWGAD